VRYFTYEVHVSKQFLITTTLASALYLCVIRFLSAAYEECFTLADAIGTDRAFTPDENQIFRLLSLHTTSPMKSSPDAAACLCKIALTVEDANIALPIAVEKYAALYVTRLQQVSVRCRLTEEQELRLLQIIHNDRIKRNATKRALENQDPSLVKMATPKMRTSDEAKKMKALIDDLDRSVMQMCAEAGIKLQSSETPGLIQAYLEKRQESAKENANGYTRERDKAKARYTQVQVDNRRRQLHWRIKSDDEKEAARLGKNGKSKDADKRIGAGDDDDDDDGDEDTFAVPRGAEQTAGQMYALPIEGGLTSDTIENVTEAFDDVRIVYQYEPELSPLTISKIAKEVSGIGYDPTQDDFRRVRPETLEGSSNALGFLFLYLLFTQQLKVNLRMLDDATPFDQYEFASILAGFYGDIRPQKKKKSGGSGRGRDRGVGILAQLVAVMARPQNKEALCNDDERQRTDPCTTSGTGYKGRHPPALTAQAKSSYDKSDPTWLAREPAAAGGGAEAEGSEGRDSKPLGDMLDGLLKWLRDQENEGGGKLLSAAQPSTPAGSKAKPGYPVHKYTVLADYGLFKRCATGTAIVDMKCEQRELRMPDIRTLKKCLPPDDELQARIDLSKLPGIGNSSKVLENMQTENGGIRLKAFTKDERLAAQTRGKFGFRFQPSGQTWEVMLDHATGAPRTAPPEAGARTESPPLSKVLAAAKERAEASVKRLQEEAKARDEVLEPSKLGGHVVRLEAAELEQPEVRRALLGARIGGDAEKEFTPGTWIEAGGAYLRPRAHPRMSHPVSKGVIDRMQTSLKTYSDTAGKKETERITKLDAAFYNFLQGIPVTTSEDGRLQEPDLGLARKMREAVGEDRANAGKEPADWTKAAVAKVDAARTQLAELSTSLSGLQSAELETVGSAVELLIKMSNEVDLPTPAEPPKSGDAEKQKKQQQECDKQMKRYTFELLRGAKQEAKIDFSFLAVSMLSKGDFKAWSQINPFLIEEQQAEMMQLMSLTLLHASAISHVNLLMLDTAKLDRQLEKVKKHLNDLATMSLGTQQAKRASDAVHVESKGVVNLADQIAAALHAERHYVDEVEGVKKYDPRFLVFEFVRSLLLRNAQVDIVRKYLDGLQPANLKLIERGAKNSDDTDLGPEMAEGTAVRFKGVSEQLDGTLGIVQKYETSSGKHLVQPDPSAAAAAGLPPDLPPQAYAMEQLETFDVRPLAQQMLMGQGKTAVITPLLCLLLANGEQLPLVLLPDSLLPAGRDIVRSTFSMVILKRVYTLTCSRASAAEQRYLQMMQVTLHP